MFSETSLLSMSIAYSDVHADSCLVGVDSSGSTAVPVENTFVPIWVTDEGITKV